MSHPDTGGPAFPRTGYSPDTADVHRDDLHAALATRTEPEPGMDLRDWFAGQALVGYLTGNITTSHKLDEHRTAVRCYQFADAMLAARNAVPRLAETEEGGAT